MNKVLKDVVSVVKGNQCSCVQHL